MVKRVKTPEAPEVVKYYTCCHPYPNSADFEDTNDYITFSRWIGIILGNNNALDAIYYKPKARGKVIFAVDKSYPRPERLLGEHRWSEFLKHPTEDEAGLKSQIFYCTYSTDRELQKHGWKCIAVESFFFANFGIDKWFTKVQYPAPHWCRPPAENPTEKPLCRPLPNAQVPRSQPSAPPQRPVVGSSDWSQMRDKTNGNGRGNTRNDVSQQKPAAGAAKRTGPQRAKTTPNQSSFPPLSPAPPGKKAQSPSPATNNGSVWGNKPSSVASAVARPSPLSAPPTSTAHAMWTVKHAKSRAGKTPPSTPSSAKRASAPTPQQRPAAAKDVNNKGENLDRARANENKTPAPNSARAGKSWRSWSSGSSSGCSGGSTTASAASSAPSSPAARGQELVDFDANAYDDENDYDEEVTHETYHESWETTSTFAPSEPPAPAVRMGNSNAKGKGREYTHPFVEAVEQEITGPTEQTNLWADVEPVIRSTGSVTAVEAKAKKENELLCPVHRGKCKKGICEAYKAMRKGQKKQETVANRKAKKEEGRRKEKEVDMNDDWGMKDEGKETEWDTKDAGKETEWDTKDEGKETDRDKKKGNSAVDEDTKDDGDMKDKGKSKGKGKDHVDENATPANKADNKQVKEDMGQSSKAKGQAKIGWDEYGSSDEDGYYDNIPSFSAKPSGRKFYDDDDYFD